MVSASSSDHAKGKWTGRVRRVAVKVGETSRGSAAAVTRRRVPVRCAKPGAVSVNRTMSGLSGSSRFSTRWLPTSARGRYAVTRGQVPGKRHLHFSFEVSVRLQTQCANASGAGRFSPRDPDAEKRRLLALEHQGVRALLLPAQLARSRMGIGGIHERPRIAELDGGREL